MGGQAATSERELQHEAEVREVLESETHVDMDKLLSLCQHGLPAVLRGEAWMYLLGVSPSEKSEEMSLGKRMGQEFAELEKALLPLSSELARCIKGEVKRRMARAPEEASRDAKTRQRLERLLRCYMHGHGNEFHPGMVHLLSPLVHVYATEVEAYFCFQELMRRLERNMTFEGCKQMAVTFMTLLRHTLPDLYFYFEEEQCSGGPWLFSWMQFLLARELPLPCVLRLWDSYFSLSLSRETSLQELHIYVCLAILEMCNEELMELDDAEVLWYLQHLPHMDMGQVLTQAFNIKDDVIASSLLM